MLNQLPDHLDPTPARDFDPFILATDGPPFHASERNVSRGKITFGLVQNCLAAADLLILLLSGYSGYHLRFGLSVSVTPADHLFIYFATTVTSLSLYLAGGYRKETLQSLNKHMAALFAGGTGALFLILLCGYLSRTLHDYSRIWFVISILIAVVLLVVIRLLAAVLLQRAVSSKQLVESIVIVGVNSQAEKLIHAIRGAPDSGIHIVGVFDDRAHDRPYDTQNPNISRRLNAEVLGSTDILLSYIRSKHVSRVVVTLPWLTSERFNALLKKLRTVPVRIDLVPNDVIWQFPNINMERLANVPVLNIVNGRIERQSGVAKRVEDIILSMLIIGLTLPLLFLIAMVIKLDSKGPVLFKQQRHGYNNHIFEVYKFRSMKVNNTPSENVPQATRHDPRTTRVGRWLRRTSLDELPQLFNVLKGDMSIVGPRPHAVQHNMQYSSTISEYFARHNVKPGITGWAQINGLRGEIDTPDKMRRRVDADLYYIEHWSLLFDLRIILLTAMTVWFQDTAY